MKITQTTSTCKSASTKPFKSIDIGVGNIVPNWMYKKILTTGGKSDTMAIALLSDLWFLYRSTGEEEHQKDYDYFCRKFNLSVYQVRESFIRLEALGVMKRSVGSIILQGRKFSNILFVTLNVKKLLEMARGNLGQKADDDESNDDRNKGSNFFSDRVGESKEDDLDIPNARDIKNNLKENRSTGSNFSANNSLSENPQSDTVTSFNVKRYDFASFYPLSESDIDALRNLSRREFSSNAVNEILLSLSKKLPLRNFPHKKAFMNYMTKALTYELRDAVKVSSESFKIKSNVSTEEATLKKQEAFLNRIEESRDTSLGAQLKKKLAGILSPATAYKLLVAASFPGGVIARESSTFKIGLNTNVELTGREQELIFEEIRAIYGDHIQDFTMTLGSRTEKQPLPCSTPGRLSEQNEAKPLVGICGRIRENLIEYYGSGGNNMDNVWFSKLEAEEDSVANELTLKAPSQFIKDWVQSNYYYLIEKFCSAYQYKLGGVSI